MQSFRRTLAGLAPLLAALPVLAGFAAGCGGGGGGAPPATVRGRIMLVGTGTPLQGATVNIGGAAQITPISGEFNFSAPSTATQIQVTAPGIKTLNQNLPALTANQVNDLGDIWVVGESGSYNAIVTGQVVRADTLDPVSGATVRLSGQFAVTGATGQFRFENVPVGLGGTEAVGLITASGFEDKPLLIDPPTGPSPPDNALGAIPLSPPVGGIPGGPSNIRGTASAAGVADMSGTVVTLTDRSSGQEVGRQTTAADGRFGFWVVAGQYTVRAVRGSLSAQQDVNLPRPDLAQTVNLTLTASP